MHISATSDSLFFKKAFLLPEKRPAMERQRSFIIKPTRLFVLSFTVSSSILFFFLFSLWVLNTTPSVTGPSEAHIQFSTDLNAIKAQAFVAFTSNFSVSESKDPILRGTHFDQAADSSEEALGPGDEWKDELNGIKTQGFVGFPSNSSYSENKGPILRETHFAQAAESPEEALDLRNERKDEVLGDPRVGKTVDSYVQVLGSVGERKEAILNVTHIRTATSSSKQGLDLVGEKEIAGSDVSKPMDEIFESKSGSATVERIGKESECDVSDGRWVFDESYPLYTNNSCPFIDEGFSCESNGRLDRDYVKWRWQLYQCSIPRFNPVKMLELIRGKRLAFVGDSINRNQWESMLCLLRGAISDPSRVYEARGRRVTNERGNYNFRFIDYQCSVEYYLSHFLVHEGKARVGQKRTKTLRIDAIDRGSSRWRGADILVFNTAHWWSHYKTKSGLSYYQEGGQVHPRLDVNVAFKKALTTWASWVDQHVTPGKTQVFFRSSAPSHFSGGEWNAGGHCRESRQPLNDAHIRNVPEKNIMVEEVVKQMRIPVTILNITALSGLRIDGHPSVYGRKPANGMSSSVQDCSHWCLPGVPDTWNELFDFHLLSRHRSVSTS